MQALTTFSTTTDSLHTGRDVTATRPAGFSIGRWLIKIIRRRIMSCAAARQARVERALRSGLARID